MQRFFCVLLAAVVLAALCCAAAAADTIRLPAELQVLEAESLKGTALHGVLDLSETAVTEIADGALDGLDLHGLILPSTIARIGTQHLAHPLDYLKVYESYETDYECAAPDFHGLGTVNNLISDLGDMYKALGIEPPSQGWSHLLETEEYEGFLYNCNDGVAKLLCAADPDLIGTSVVIPDRVAGYLVSLITPGAFDGCGQVTKVILPPGAEVQEGAFDGCPNAQIIQPDDAHTLVVWADSISRDVYMTRINAFMADHPEYGDYFIRYEEYGADMGGEVAYDPTLADLYTIAQDQLYALYGEGCLDPAPAGALSGQDGKALDAVTVDGSVMAYPISGDNGYFLFYDPEIVTHPGDLDGILADCEANNAVFAMEITSGWYQVSFFFGAGCRIEYSTEGEGDIDVDNPGGLAALKAMIRMHKSPAFLNLSSAVAAQETAASDGKRLGAIVSGVWDAGQLPGFVPAKLPAFDGYQMGSFSGYRYLAVNPTGGPGKAALAHQLAAVLTGTETQVALYNEAGYIPTRAEARQQVTLGAVAAALAAQNAYATPQGGIPGFFWNATGNLGRNIIDGVYDEMSDGSLGVVLEALETELTSAE